MTRFTKSLEEKADQLAQRLPKKKWDPTIPGMLRREIALTVDQIKRLRGQHEEQFLRLLRVECYVDTELMQMEQRQMVHGPFPEKDKLRQRLFEIEKERRTLSLRLEEKTQTLETRLLELMNRHDQLNPEP